MRTNQLMGRGSENHWRNWTNRNDDESDLSVCPPRSDPERDLCISDQRLLGEWLIMRPYQTDPEDPNLSANMHRLRGSICVGYAPNSRRIGTLSRCMIIASLVRMKLYAAQVALPIRFVDLMTMILFNPKFDGPIFREMVYPKEALSCTSPDWY